MKNTLETKNGKLIETSQVEVDPFERRAALMSSIENYNLNINHLIVARDEAQAVLDQLELLYDFSVEVEKPPVADLIVDTITDLDTGKTTDVTINPDFLK